MREFFSLEGSFNKYMGFVADTFVLSLLWIFFSFVTVGIGIGASSTALFYVASRRIANREGYISSDFWAAFKSNFLRATLVWAVIFLLVSVILVSIFLGVAMGDELPLGWLVLPVQIVTLAEIIFISVYLFPVLARFDMPIREAVKTSFFMANRHLLTSVICAVIPIGLVTFAVGVPQVFPLVFAVPGIYGICAAHLIMKVFKKYRPEMDKDPILELQEIERQRNEEKRRAEIGRKHAENYEEEPE